jgi:hypothetical protein
MEKIRKVEKTFERSYHPVVIWFDDLAAIIETLKQRVGGVQLRTENYRYDSLEELKEHVGGQTQFALEIVGSKPGGSLSVSLELKRMSLVKLWVFDPQGGPEAAQVFHEIDDTITGCQRRPAQLYSGWALFFGLLALVALPYVMARNETTERGLLVAGSMFFLWSIWVIFVSACWSAVIRLQRRAEVRPFLARNKDQLLLLLIGAIIGGCVTFASVVLKEHFYPSTTTGDAPKIP